MIFTFAAAGKEEAFGQSSSKTSVMSRLKTLLPYTALFGVLVSPAILVNVAAAGSRGMLAVCISVLAAVLAFVLPVCLFHNNLRCYFYLLTPLVILTPAFLFATFYFGVPPGFELIVFVLQTNAREAREAVGPFTPYFIAVDVGFVGIYVWAIRRIRPDGIPLRLALLSSVGAIALLLAITCYSNELYYKTPDQITRKDMILKYDYPYSLVAGIREAQVFLAKNNLKKAETFSFRAVKNDTLNLRQVYVLIIGESSRYDRWQLNGYHRATSPRLSEVRDLISYKDVVSGAHYTWVSVPQIITRANPDNYDLQYREKSILAVFQEAGFKTCWLSNQSDQDVFWSGSITLHAKTADVYSFSPTYSPNMEYEEIYDGRLLPQLDSILQADGRNLFVVLHTMGNHWEYSRRYPAAFDVFKPSGKTVAVNASGGLNREPIVNSYDNSILYADYLIDSVINLVNSRAELSTVMYVSDHGEDLFDKYSDRSDFHFNPSAATLRVPLFVWTSASYSKYFPEKRKNLEANQARSIGAENIFYTLGDIANIRMEGFDSTRSFAHKAFIPSKQKYYGDDKRGHSFAELNH